MRNKYRKVGLKTGVQGLFHCWGLDVIEYRDSASSFTMAVVEMPDGSCEFVHPSDFKFVDTIEEADQSDE